MQFLLRGGRMPSSEEERQSNTPLRADHDLPLHYTNFSKTVSVSRAHFPQLNFLACFIPS